MMNIKFLLVAFAILILSFTLFSGCVAPPKDVVPPAETVTQGGGGYSSGTTNSNAGQANPGMTTPALVAQATVYPTRTSTPTLYQTQPVFTPVPEDQVCLIYKDSFNMTFQVKTIAKSFDLKNPPMYINYTLTNPFNVTGTKISQSQYNNQAGSTISYSYYAPYSYFEVTVRNATTGEIYTQDGFGTKYDQNLNKTIQINTPGQLLIEMKGFNVTPTVGFWVKPSQNINESVDLSTTECETQAYVKRLNQIGAIFVT